MAIKHFFTSAKADGADTTVVRPTDWNADHTITTYPFFSTILLPNNSNFTQRVIPFVMSTVVTQSTLFDPFLESTAVGPFILPRTAQLQKIHFEVTTGYTAINFRLVLYAHDEVNDRPGALIADSGDISADDAAVKLWDLTASEETLVGGVLYWLGIHWPNTDTTGACRMLNPALQPMLSLGKTGADVAAPGPALLALSQTTAAPADPFPTSHNMSNSLVLPLLWTEFID